jgi:VIT1/CCC1 family predicted Fe2+/Mn2+ transporter
MVLGPVYDGLVVAFGVGVWMSAHRRRALRVVGGLFVGFGIVGGLAWPFAAMHQREVLAAGGGTWSDTLHVILGLMTVLFMLVAIGVGATAFGKPFRLYSIVTILILFVFGTLTGLDSPRLQANLPTPWIGLWERINIFGFLLWVVVLAAALLRVRDTATDRRS